jgi:hypothetical protein
VQIGAALAMNSPALARSQLSDEFCKDRPTCNL